MATIEPPALVPVTVIVENTSDVKPTYGSGPDQIPVPAAVNPDAGRIAHWMDHHLAADWRQGLHLHSVQVAVFWGVMYGLWVALPAFQYWVDPRVFAGLAIFGAVTIGLARFTKQPGLPDV